MNRPNARPLLRVAAMGASMLSCAPATGTPAPTEASVAKRPDSRVHLRGTVTSAPEDRVTLQVSTPSGSGPLIVLPAGPSPRPFELTDADLGGLVIPGEEVTLTALQEQGHRGRRVSMTVPLRTGHLQLSPHQIVDAPLPEGAVPSEDAVRGLPPAAPDERGSHLDIQGVLVFDNRRGTPKASVHVRDERGVVSKTVTGPSPVSFRIQDADAAEGYPVKGDTVTLSAIVHFGDGRMLEQALTVPARAKGVVLVPTYEPPAAPPPPEITSVALDLKGVVAAPPSGDVTEVTVHVVHAGGTTAVSLPAGPWPRPFHLTGPAWEDVPVHGGSSPTVTVFARVNTAGGEEHTAALTTPVRSDAITLAPKLPEPNRVAPARPIYGNTKGSRYDDGSAPTPTKR